MRKNGDQRKKNRKKKEDIDSSLFEGLSLGFTKKAQFFSIYLIKLLSIVFFFFFFFII